MPGPTVETASERPRVVVIAGGDDQRSSNDGAPSAPFSSRWLTRHYELHEFRLPAAATGTLIGGLGLGARIARALLKARPGLVHLRCDTTAPLAAQATCLAVSHLLRLPTVVEVADDEWLDEFDRLPSPAQARMRRRFARADVCFVRNDATATALHRRLGRRSRSSSCEAP